MIYLYDHIYRCNNKNVIKTSENLILTNIKNITFWKYFSKLPLSTHRIYSLSFFHVRDLRKQICNIYIPSSQKTLCFTGFFKFSRYVKTANRKQIIYILYIIHLYIAANSVESLTTVTAHKMKFSIKDFFSKCDQIRRKLCSKCVTGKCVARIFNSLLCKQFGCRLCLIIKYDLGSLTFAIVVASFLFQYKKLVFINFVWVAVPRS